MKPRTGFFKYDLFPYVVTRKILSWNDEGDAVLEGGYVAKHSSLLHSLPLDESGPATDAVRQAESSYRTEKERIRKIILRKLYDTAPFLRPEGG